MNYALLILTKIPLSDSALKILAVWPGIIGSFIVALNFGANVIGFALLTIASASLTARFARENDAEMCKLQLVYVASCLLGLLRSLQTLSLSF